MVEGFGLASRCLGGRIDHSGRRVVVVVRVIDGRKADCVRSLRLHHRLATSSALVNLSCTHPAVRMVVRRVQDWSVGFDVVRRLQEAPSRSLDCNHSYLRQVIWVTWLV